jgi:predicted phosphodiesterase
MAGARLLVDDERAQRLSRALLRVVALAAIVVATLAGGYFALVSFRQDRTLSVGTIKLSISPGHKGALDVYVPLVDWGARFEAIRLPARLRVDLRTIDRDTVKKVATGHRIDVARVRKEARDGIATYLRNLILTVLLCGGSLGVLTAFAVRGGATPKLRYTVGTAIGTALITAGALVLFLPPRGQIDAPQYYAFGPDIPRALSAVEAAQRGSKALDQELNAQLVGLARLVTAPGNRPALEDRPRFTLASDLHNNIVAIPILERTAAKGPVFFPGDLTDRGSPVEASVVSRVIHTGSPFVFVPGNHDSDQLSNRLAREGAIVLTRTGRLDGHGQTTGEPIVKIKGIRVAGYDDPYERSAGEGFADIFQKPDQTEIERFATWLRPLRDDVDIVMVHNPALLPDALRELDDEHRAKPLLFLVGHTHHSELDRLPGATIINAGTVGAGGTGNLKEHSKVGIARVTYETTPSFIPLAADLVEIDPGSGNATARRERLDESPLP